MTTGRSTAITGAAVVIGVTGCPRLPGGGWTVFVLGLARDQLDPGTQAAFIPPGSP